MLQTGISYGGMGALGFALRAAGDPEIWTKQSSAQQTWIADTLRKLNDKIVSSTGSTCPTWNPSNIGSITGCFQIWFNANYKGNTALTASDGKPLVLRTDGVFDQQTLDALRTVVAVFQQDFPTPFPGTSLPGPVQEEKKGLSTGAMLGIGAGVAVLGGIVYAASSGRRRG